jgi:hypothetical protein
LWSQPTACFFSGETLVYSPSWKVEAQFNFFWHVHAPQLILYDLPIMQTNLKTVQNSWFNIIIIIIIIIIINNNEGTQLTSIKNVCWSL